MAENNSKLISLAGLKSFKEAYDIEIDKKISEGGIGVKYSISKNGNGEIVLTGSDESVTKVTDANTTYSFVENNHVLTITGTDGTSVDITLGGEITKDAIIEALGFTPAKASDIPNVPEWALAENKPTYTASEVGALADTVTHLSGDVPTTTTINNKPLSDNITLSASDVGALADTTEIPETLSDLTDDANHRLVTDDNISAWNSKVGEVKAGSTNGTISVDGTDVSIGGLDKVAYIVENTSTYESDDNVLYTSNIVDNLYTESSTDVLSARQGSLLNDNILKVMSATDGAGTNMFTENVNEFYAISNYMVWEMPENTDESDYTLSITQKAGVTPSGNYYFGWFDDPNPSADPKTYDWLIRGGTVVSIEKTAKTRKYLVVNPKSTDTVNAVLRDYNIQLEKGNKSTAYMPFAKRSISGLNQVVDSMEDSVNDIKYLGWAVPDKFNIKNYVDDDGIFHQKVNRINLGILDWAKQSLYFNTTTTISDLKYSTATATVSNLYIADYTTVSNTKINTNDSSDLEVACDSSSATIKLRNKSCASVDDLKTLLNGKYLYYELKTEVLINETCTQGKSAYEIAVDNGFVGTEEEWLESLKGKDGRNGRDGMRGEKGETGASGGVTTPLNGFFTMYVDNDGNLYALCESDMSDYFEYDSDTGNLYFLTDDGEE